ncbi:MAG: hypothetical protein P1V35_05295 [Planctomycetota bacterium]|nr:hypothetical protein [Planctomycetota bacterium]
MPISKSLLQRALLGAAWVGGPVRLDFPVDPGVPGSQGADVAGLILALGALGLEIHPGPAHSNHWDLVAPGFGVLGHTTVALGESGTAARICTAALAFAGASDSRRNLAVSGTLQHRVSPPLMAALERSGCRVFAPGPGTWPLEVTSVPMPKELVIEDPVSSQEVSALLYALAFGGGGRLVVDGPIPSEPYVQMTIGTLAAFGCPIRMGGNSVFECDPRESTARPNLQIESDASSAAVVWVGGVLSGREVSVIGIPERSCQGDVSMLDILTQLGVGVRFEASSGWSVGGIPDRGVQVDLKNAPDLAPPLVALAAGLALGHFGGSHSSRITGLGTLQGKESPRLQVLGQALVDIGIPAEWTEDSLQIPKGRAVSTPVELDARGDHRMAFAFALMSLVVPSIDVVDRGCVSKSWPRFWEDMSDILESKPR